MKQRFSSEPDTRLWTDIVSHNQHLDLSSDDWITNFERHIEGIGRTVLILEPWEQPVPFSRAWCLLEIFYTHRNKKTLEVFVCEREKEQFRKSLASDVKGTFE